MPVISVTFFNSIIIFSMHFHKPFQEIPYQVYSLFQYMLTLFHKILVYILSPSYSPAVNKQRTLQTQDNPSSSRVRTRSSATRSYAMNCQPATPSVWGNLTGMCFCSNARVQSSWDNVKKSENPTQTIC